MSHISHKNDIDLSDEVMMQIKPLSILKNKKSIKRIIFLGANQRYLSFD